MLSPLSNRFYGVLNWVKDDEFNEYTILIRTSHLRDYEKAETKKNVRIIPIDTWDENHLLIAAEKLYAEKKFERVFAYNEDEIVTAALIREKYGLEGQQRESAFCYRNKYLMKRRVAEAGLAVPHFMLISNLYEIERFVEQYGYPIVVKPVDGAGAIGVSVIHDKDELLELSAANNLTGMLCEEYIPWDVCHIDGLVVNSELKYLFASKYINPCISFLEECGASVGSVLLDEDGEESKLVKKFAKRVIEALPNPEHFLFHLEVFSNGKEVKFCEIASRMGGGRIKQCISNAFGIDPVAELLKIETARPVSSKLDGEMKFPCTYGWLFSGPKRGKLVSYPKIIKEEDVFDQYIFAYKNKVYKKADSCVLCVIGFSIKGDSYEKVRNRLIELDTWYKGECIYEQEDAQ